MIMDFGDSRALRQAQDSGTLAGAQMDKTGCDCPYDHNRLDLRAAWFEGFGQGRISAENR